MSSGRGWGEGRGGLPCAGGCDMTCRGKSVGIGVFELGWGLCIEIQGVGVGVGG